MHELAEYLERPSAAIAAEVFEALAEGPIDPSMALPAGELDRLLEPGYLEAETGFCTNADGSGYVAVLTRMPGVTAEMIEWWFEWHPHDPVRYRIWYPEMHFDTGFEPAKVPGAKPFHGTVHHPVEDIGLGRARIRIEFVDPVAFGFPRHDFAPATCSTIICGYVGDDVRRVRHTRLCHFVRDTDDGVEMRSRFWIGNRISLYSESPLAKPVNRLLNTRLIRSRAVPKRAPRALAQHCAQEYANLAAMLPELWARYGAT